MAQPKKTDTEAWAKKLYHWGFHPLDWVKAIFGDNLKKSPLASKLTETGLSMQQEAVLVLWGRFLEAKMKRAMGKPLTDEEAELSGKIGMSIMSGTGCHAPGTPIMMADGTITHVELIKVGDELMGDDSTPRRVLSLARGNEMMYRIRYKNGEYYDVNENHILSLRCSGNHARKYVKGAIHNMTVKEYLTLNGKEKHLLKGYKVPVDFPERELPIPPYILGLFLGDGCFSAPELTTIDPELIAEWGKWGESLGLTLQERSHKAWRITSGKLGGGNGNGPLRNPWMELLKATGLYRCKHIPEIYLRSSREQRLELLAGLMDTDGTLDARKGRVFSIVQKNESIASQIVWLCRSLGMHATMTAKEKSWTHKGVKFTGTYYEVHIARKVEDIPCRLARKQATKIDNGMELNFGFDVIPLGHGDFYGFELDGNNLFLLGDFTVTHNTGKDFTAAIITWHFMFCFHYPKCLATANTGKQLKDVFWSELAKVQSLAVKSRPDDPDCLNELQQAFTIQSEIMFANLPKNQGLGNRWFCRAVTINAKASPEEQGEALAGRHEDYQLFVLDEASGIPDAVFKPVEGTLTGIINVVFCIFNPTRTHGFAVRSHYEEKDKWVTVRWNSEESEIVSKAHIANLARYGVDSPTYRCRVLGLPPYADKNTLIPMDWVMSAVERWRNKEIVALETDPLIIGCDIGGGGDKSVIVSRQGGLVDAPVYNNAKDSTVVEDWTAGEYDRRGANGGNIDVIGIGHGVFWRLRKRGYNFRPGDARRQAKDPDRFYNARAEACWRLRDMFEKGLIAIPDCQDLIDQCGSIKYFPEQKNKVQLKSEIVRDLGHSPDEFDALAQTCYYDDSVFVVSGKDNGAMKALNVFQR